MSKPRQDYVFVKPCGCAVAVVVKGQAARDEDAAWREIYGRSARAKREAAARGITCVLVDHEVWVRDYSESMLNSCSHEAVGPDA